MFQVWISTFFVRFQSSSLQGERICRIWRRSGRGGWATSVSQVVLDLFDDVLYIIDDSFLGARRDSFFGDGQLLEDAVPILEVRRQMVVQIAHFGRPVVFDGHLPLEAASRLLRRRQMQLYLFLRQSS